MRDEALLDFARGAELRCCAGLLAVDAGEAEEDDDGDGEQKEEIAEIDRLNGNRTELNRIVEEVEVMPPVKDGHSAEIVKRECGRRKQAGQNQPTRFPVTAPDTRWRAGSA